MTIVTAIEDGGCGCGDALRDPGLATIDQALEHIARSVGPLQETESIPLAAALGRSLAEPVRARLAVPPFDNSAMDGYAINTASLSGQAPWRLDVVARIPAGQEARAVLPHGCAAQVFTGAPVPGGADAVVMQEDVRRCGTSVVISRPVRPGTHIRRSGEDMTAGEAILPQGRCLSARDIAACAAAGAASVAVRRRIRAALVVTGDEVTGPGQALEPAGIWDVNTPMLSAAMAGAGVDLCHVGTGRDGRASLRDRIAEVAGDVDLVVTTGGISVGEEDHVKPALADLGASILFSGVAIKPGKPVSVARLGSAWWLGLPGNPLSAFLTWELFGTAILRRLAGTDPVRAAGRMVKLSGPIRHKPGRSELRLATFVGTDRDGLELARPEDATHSGRVARLPMADGVIVIPSDTEMLPQGALVRFLPFCNGQG